MSTSSSSTKSNVSATIDATLEQLGLSRADIDSLVSASQEELKPYLDKAKVRAKDDTKKVEDMLAPYANKAQDYANKITEAWPDARFRMEAPCSGVVRASSRGANARNPHHLDSSEAGGACVSWSIGGTTASSVTVWHQNSVGLCCKATGHH